MRLDSRAAIYCHEFLHKKFAPNAFPNLRPDPIDPVVQEFKDQGFAHEKRTIIELDAAIPGIIHIPQNLDSTQIQMETAKALLDPEAFIITGAYIGEVAEQELARLQGREFVSTQRVSRPDLIIKIGQRPDGRSAWAPVDIKSHNPIDENKSNVVYVAPITSILPFDAVPEDGRLDLFDLHQLAHYTRQFQALDIGNEDLWVGVIGRNSANCIWARIGDVVTGQGKGQESFLSQHDQKFKKAREIVRLSEIENQDTSKKAGVISINSTGKMGCTVCIYKTTCLSEMKSFDSGNGHVTLLARVTPLVVEKSFPSIQSIREMREAEPLNDAMLTAQIRARVWETKIPELLDPSTPLVIPEADIEIDIDLENSMEALRELDINEPMGVDRLYLYGYGIHDRTISKDWRTAVIETIFDYSNTEEGEFRVMSQMWNKLQEEISKAESTGRTIKIFHYANHEFMWWTKFANRFAGKTGVPTITEVDTFKGNYLIDLLPYARRISFPAMDSSIKSLAPLAGFEWEVRKAGGANSLLKYKQATTSKSQAERDEAIAWLDSYNRDDVRATFAVRNYMRSLTMPGKALWSPE
jgi:hypothetical protein